MPSPPPSKPLTIVELTTDGYIGSAPGVPDVAFEPRHVVTFNAIGGAPSGSGFGTLGG